MKGFKGALLNLIKGGTKTPSKNIPLNRLKQIKQDNNIGENGVDYTESDLNDAITERKISQANKMVSGAANQERKRAKEAQSTEAPSFPPPMKKGVNQRLFPVAQEQKEHRSNFNNELNSNLYNWQTLEDRKAKEKLGSVIGQLPKNTSKRAMIRLSGKTPTRRNPNTGELESLLHRGISQREKEKNVNVPSKSMSHNIHMAWTPNINTARDFYNTKNSQGGIVSSWIPHSSIATVPMHWGQDNHEFSDHSNPYKGKNQHANEHEVIVKPGKYDLVHTNEVQRLTGQDKHVAGNSIKTLDQAINARSKVTSSNRPDIAETYANERGRLKRSELQKGANGDWKKEGYRIKPVKELQDPSHGKYLKLEAFDRSGKSVGRYSYGKSNNGPLSVSFIQTHPDHQRKGIASAAHQMAEKHFNEKIVRDHQSPDAQALWAQPNRKFGKSENQVYSHDYVVGSAQKAGNPDILHGSAFSTRYKPDQQFHLKNIPISSLYRSKTETPSTVMHHETKPEYDKNGKLVGGDEFYAQGFADQHNSGDTAEPIIVHPDLEGRHQIIDGRHRARAAYLRGETHIKAFVPVNNSSKIFNKHEEYFWEDLHKANRQIGEAHPQARQVWDRMSNGVEAWRHNDSEKSKIENQIKNNFPAFLNKYPKEAHASIKKLYDSSMNDPDRHFIPSQRGMNNPVHQIRSRFLNKLISGDRDAKLEVNGPNASFKMIRHKPVDNGFEEFTSTWHAKPEGNISYDNKNYLQDFQPKNMPMANLPTKTNEAPATRVSQGVMVRRGGGQGNTVKSENHTKRSNLPTLNKGQGAVSGRDVRLNAARLQNLSKRERDLLQLFGVPKSTATATSLKKTQGQIYNSKSLTMERYAALKSLDKTELDVIFESMEKSIASKILLPTMIAAGTMMPNKISQTKMPQQPKQAQAQGLDKKRMLAAIAEVESRSGKDVNHKPTASGTAYGAYGLMPSTIKETIAKDRNLNAKHRKALDLDDNLLHSYMDKNPNLQHEIASVNYDKLHNRFGDDLAALSFGWLNGTTGTIRAKNQGKDLNNHWHVSKVRNIYNRKP